MPIGSGVETLRLLPSVPYVIDPPTFAAMTTENVSSLTPIADPGPAGSARYELPDADVVAHLRITFEGTLTSAGGVGVPHEAWPYGLLEQFTLTANGISHDLWSVSGRDLHVHDFVHHPGQFLNADVFPGAVGGGGAAVATGAHPLYLTWDVPITTDDAWLVASLFAQSSQTLLNGTIKRAAEASLNSSGADWTITGTFTITETSYEIPIDGQGRMVLPDVSRLHQVIAVDESWTNAGGENPITLLRTAGQLMRVFFQADGAANAPLSANPGTPTTAKIDELKLMYGLRATPYDFDPASVLALRNQRDYGSVVPYDYLVIDQMVRNPVRDMVLLQGVTNLRLVPVIDSAVVPTQGQANLHAVEEILI